jgi:hypothetical protein
MQLDFPDQNQGPSHMIRSIQKWFASQTRLDLAFGGIAILLVLLCGVFMVSILRNQARSAEANAIRFNPNDVVYSPKYQAIHEMGSEPSHATQLPILQQNNGTPQIRVSELFYDFGVVKNTAVLTRTVVIANPGSALLTIRKAYTTCGCTTADFTSVQIPPGKVALMTIRFDTGYHDIQGSTVRRGVILETNDMAHPTEEIWVQATVK